MSVQVPQGYKQTVLGVLPSNWTIDVLSSFWTVTDCKHITAKFFDDGYPLASIAEVQSRYLDFSKCKKTNFNYYKKLIDGGRQPKTGDLVLSRNATVGEVAQVADWHPQFAMGQDVCLLRKKNSNFSTDYLQNIFGSFFIQKQLSDLMVGSTFKRANIQQIKSLIVPMPEPLEQKEIASALADVELLIESLEQLIAKKCQIKQGAMQELLTGQRRLPGFSGEWVRRSLDEVADVIDPHPSHRAPNEVPNGIPFLGIGDFDENGNIVGKKLRFVDPSVLEEHAGRYCLDDALIGLGRVASIGKVVSLKKHDDGYAISPTLGVIRGRDVGRDFLIYSLKSSFVKDQFLKIMSGSTRSSVGMQVLRELIIELPPSKEEQNSIATCLKDMDYEIEILDMRLDKARQIKQSMMQELLTGRIRLV